MKTLLTAVLAVAAASPALAVSGADLAKAKNCMACHAIDSKVVGPAYKDVAAKYSKNQKEAIVKLAEKIQKGGSGVWGTVPMPPNQVTPEEATTLAKWVLTGK